MTSNPDDKGSRSIRALEVAEALAAAGRPLSVAGIAEATGLPKATAHRLCGLLVEQRFLAPDPSGDGLNVGGRLRDLAMEVISADMAHVHRHRILADLSRELGETCNFNIPVGGAMYYVDRVEAEWPLRTQLPVGTRVPLHCTASGKLYLSSLPKARRKKLINAMDLESHTGRTLTDPDALLENLEKIRKDKVGTDDQEFIDGMAAVAVPVMDARGRLAATLACHGPTVRMPLEKALSFVPALRRAAEKLSGGETSG